MADQINLFDLFEDTFGEDTVITEVAPAKEEKKEEKKATKKASSKKEVIPEKITLPVTVYASQWKEEISEIDGKTEVTLDELKDYLVGEGYVEIKASFTEVVKEEEGVVVGISGAATSYPATPLLGEEFTVATGQYTMTLNAEADFEGLDKNLGVVCKKWEEQYPQYINVKLVTDLSNGYGYPIAGDSVTEVPEGTAKVYYNGAIQEISVESKLDADGFVKLVTGIAGGSVYKTADDVYFVAITRKKSAKGGGKSTSSKPAPKPVEKQKFTLPFKATFTHCEDKEITSEQFPDKTEITEDEFIAWLGTQYDEYTADKTELLYFKNDNVVEVRLKSAKRG